MERLGVETMAIAALCHTAVGSSRDDGSTGLQGLQYACWTMENPGGTVTLGAAVFGDPDFMATRSIDSNDGKWHYYAGTYDPVTGIRSLYVDGVLAANETHNGSYTLAPQCHLCFGAKDQPPGDDFVGPYTGEMYDVRIYNYAITQGQAAAVGRVSPTMTVTTNAGQLKLTWLFGHLVSATNLAGPWTFNASASTFTIVPSATNAQLYFRVQNP